ncbi:glyoxalase [Philodulcilactobacillus myokoensis]|uniref:Glyoxalase n=1 Tax=Philodulcilactobacillus myokoensis TaxID=2929573 RepID=A0A9W6ESP8_9LACO|nr:VOC family protein [Philodulcilactobacillus myokoensis]GLB46568.1 glyoxalase [Philodulcilactobacillus myokoensis]
MKVKDIDHVTLFSDDLEKSMRFYHEALDLPVVKFQNDRLELQLGKQKLIILNINAEMPAKPGKNIAGGGSFSLISKDPLEYLTNHFANYGVDILAGPLKIRGANGMMNAIYIHDPDQNLIEICESK